MAAPRDASTEHSPFERKSESTGRHPRTRKGATAKKREKELAGRQARQEVEKTTPQKGGKRK